jgi:anaphase-promoting complex subunit 4
VVRLVGLESSKAVHQIRVVSGDGGGDGAAKIGLIAWGRNVTGENRERKGGYGNGERQERRRILLDGERTGDVAVDLPRELVFLEVETALPKLSPLPAGGSGYVLLL